MMRDCTVFHSNCGPLGPFLTAAIRLSPSGAQRRGLKLLALISTPNLNHCSESY